MKKVNWLMVTRISALSSLAVLIFATIVTAVLGALTVNEMLRLETVKTICSATLFLSSFLVSMIAAKKVGHRKVVVSMIVAGCVVSCLMMIKLTLFAGCDLSAMRNMALIFVATLLGGIAASQKKSRR